MNSTEDLLNQIELLKQALLFYANADNYGKEPEVDLTPVDLDNGEQARFALKRLQETIDLNQEMEDEYIKELKEKYDESQPPESVLRLIEEIKKVGGDGDV